MFVHEDVHEDFISTFVSKVKNLSFGNPFDNSTNIGPLINFKGLKKVEAQIEDALAGGAILHCGDEFLKTIFCLIKKIAGVVSITSK